LQQYYNLYNMIENREYYSNRIFKLKFHIKIFIIKKKFAVKKHFNVLIWPWSEQSCGGCGRNKLLPHETVTPPPCVCKWQMFVLFDIAVILCRVVVFVSLLRVYLINLMISFCIKFDVWRYNSILYYFNIACTIDIIKENAISSIC